VFVTVGCSNIGEKATATRFKGLTSNHYMKGLLEAEPLHFTCHAASDGTKMEKIEPGVIFLRKQHYIEHSLQHTFVKFISLKVWIMQ
jgi:hypothetical protein